MDSDDWFVKVLQSGCEMQVKKYIDMFNRITNDENVTPEFITGFWKLIGSLINIEIRKYEEKVNAIKEKKMGIHHTNGSPR